MPGSLRARRHEHHSTVVTGNGGIPESLFFTVYNVRTEKSGNMLRFISFLALHRWTATRPSHRLGAGTAGLYFVPCPGNDVVSRSDSGAGETVRYWLYHLRLVNGDQRQIVGQFVRRKASFVGRPGCSKNSAGLRR